MSMQAYVTKDAHQAEVKLVNRPEPEAGEALIKVKSVTINPTDWKHVQFMSPPGAIVGCDFAGVVESINGSSDCIKVGDRVASFVHGSMKPDRGSFAEYVKTDSSLLMKIPEGLSDEQASSVGIGGTTAVQALFHRLKLNKPTPSQGLPPPSADSPQILIWSGSTAVGQYAIQLARAAGYHVITTASPKHHAFLKELGASETYDYKEERLPEKISKEHPKLSKALDCISEGGSQSLVIKCLGKEVAGEICVLLAPEKEAKALREDVKIIHTLIYTMLGRPFQYGKSAFDEALVKGDREQMLEWLSGEGLLYQLFDKKLIQGPKIRTFDGGLGAIEEALNYMKGGNVSGEKLAVNISV